MHSVADVANQLLLKLGLQRSKRAPTQQHQYGETRACVRACVRACARRVRGATARGARGGRPCHAALAPFSHQQHFSTTSTHQPTHPCNPGFYKEKYVFALISAVGIFCLGAGASVVHGIQVCVFVWGGGGGGAAPGGLWGGWRGWGGGGGGGGGGLVA